MRLRPAIALMALACVACSARRGLPDSPEDCGQPAPLGDPSQMKTTVGAPEGPRIDAPKFCSGQAGSATGAYIRVHGSGQRRIAMGHGPIDAGCDHAPPAGSGPEVCPEVSADGFGYAVNDRLKAIGIEPTGIGLGICGDASGDYDAWNLSISVRDWRQVDAAIQAVDAELERWDIGHFFGVSVRGIDCVVPL